MPMCDAYIPAGALDPEAERVLLATITDILVSHEVRRIFDLMDDPKEREESIARAQSIAWTFVHRCETYVAGKVPEAPYYRFLASVPEGQLDDLFIPAINRDIYAALRVAEGGRWPDLGSRVWIFAQEVPDGTWGAHGLQLHLKEIIDFVSPGWGHVAVQRWQQKLATEAAATISLAATASATT